MIQVPLIDELRDIRRRLADEQNCDPGRYAEMLREAARRHPGPVVKTPIRVDTADYTRREAVA